MHTTYQERTCGHTLKLPLTYSGSGIKTKDSKKEFLQMTPRGEMWTPRGIPGEGLPLFNRAEIRAARRVIVAMQHRDKDGNSKILKKCTLPLTGENCIHLGVTYMAVLDLSKDGFILKEFAPGMTVDDVKAATDAPLKVDPEVKPMPV